MTVLAGIYARTHNVFGDQPPGERPVIRTRGKYRFRYFVAPDGYWPHPYTIEQALGVLRWMAETGKGDRGVMSLLNCKPTCLCNGVDPITSIADLRRRFQYAVLSRDACGGARRWRFDHDIRAEGEAIIHFPHYQYSTFGKSEAKNEQDLSEFLGIAGGKIKCQLNQYHPRAIAVHGIELTLVAGPGYEFDLRYGYARDRGSSWTTPLARQEKGEPFMAMFVRARARFEELSPNGEE